MKKEKKLDMDNRPEKKIVFIGVDMPTRLRSTWSGSFLICFNFALTRLSLS